MATPLMRTGDERHTIAVMMFEIIRITRLFPLSAKVAELPGVIERAALARRLF